MLSDPGVRHRSESAMSEHKVWVARRISDHDVHFVRFFPEGCHDAVRGNQFDPADFEVVPATLTIHEYPEWTVGFCKDGRVVILPGGGSVWVSMPSERSCVVRAQDAVEALALATAQGFGK